MARGKRMFKQTSAMHLENVGEDGNFNSFLRLKKQQDQFTSAYIDYVKISFIRQDQQAVIGVNDSALGVMFVASNKGSLENTGEADIQSNSQHIISCATSSTSTCKSVYLPIKRSIKENEMNPDAGFGCIDLFIKTTDPSGGSDIKFFIVTEVYGRWHAVQNL